MVYLLLTLIVLVYEIGCFLTAMSEVKDMELTHRRVGTKDILIFALLWPLLWPLAVKWSADTVNEKNKSC